MESRLQIFDSNGDKSFVKVSNNYFNLSEAKGVYGVAKEEEGADNTIRLEYYEESDEKSYYITFGVEEAEQLALTLLNLSDAIKR
ncbi:hypothetical protein [Terribacillus sp. DMT04]|uniref:hypothetical protein n=1 Tax=Terribacillus sp. DMT04 TaxID=2850441 RepID=UPI001C2CC1F5|nr:hypothetical protein [Terribacillus sp. DMT04]QXE01730.1 hypothetical protein KS242_00115 [Terribacillus sp. DMT04]